MPKLSEMVFVRVTPELKLEIKRYAERLRLRPADIVRCILANELAEADDQEVKEKHSKKENAQAG